MDSAVRSGSEGADDPREDARAGRGLASVDLDDPAFLTGDRQAGYARLRDRNPVLRRGAPGSQIWMLSRHADVHALVSDPTTRVQLDGTVAPGWLPAGPAHRRLRANLVQADPPVHTRLRGIVAPLFTAGRSEEWRAAAAAEVERILADRLGRPIDAVDDVAAGIPRGLLRLILGIPEEDFPHLQEFRRDFAEIFSLSPLSDAARTRLDAVTRFFLDYFDDLLGRERPTALVQVLLEAERAGQLSRDEVLSLAHTVLDAGFETTRTSITNLMQICADRPDLLPAVAAEPGLVPGLVEEVLRVRPPLEAGLRVLTVEFTSSTGALLSAGARVLYLIGAANTDERAFTRPREVDPRRADGSRSVSFGGGRHHCLGAHLARLQLQETVRGLAHRVERITCTAPEAVRRVPSLVFPSLVAYPIRLEPR